MFAQDEEIFITIIASTALMVFLVAVIVFAVIRYQNKLRKHLQEINEMKIEFQNEVLKAQIEKEEQTMQRMSVEIHDNIGQLLSLVKLNLNTIDLTGCAPPLQEKVNTTKDLIGKTILDLRQLTKSMNSVHLMRQYLSKSLQSELDIFNKTAVFKTNFILKGEERFLEPKKQLILFRIVQEALNNIIKHAKAGEVSIYLNYETESLNLKIADNGIGFDYEPQSQPKGTGIGNMNYRAELIGAVITIESFRNKGTSININTPYKQLQYDTR